MLDLRSCSFMRYCILLFLFGAFAFGLDVSVYSGRENNQNFATLTLYDKQPFNCYEQMDVNGNITSIQCRFNSALSTRLIKSQSLFFHITPQVIPINEDFPNGGLILNISPSQKDQKIKLFNAGFTPPNSYTLPAEKPKMSSRWQVLGYIGDMPFFSKKRSTGLNFPLSIEGMQIPTIGALDLDAKPMQNDNGLDIPLYLNVKNQITQKNYLEALNLSNEFFTTFPNSLFKRDVLYYKMFALFNLQRDEDRQETIEIGRAWIGAYPSDVRIPEMLYMLGQTYALSNSMDEARYYFQRIFEEYPQSRFAGFARLDYAQRLYETGNLDDPTSTFTDILETTKDFEVASTASFYLANYYFGTHNFKLASEYLEKILAAYPQFFHDHTDKRYATLVKWIEESNDPRPTRSQNNQDDPNLEANITFP